MVIRLTLCFTVMLNATCVEITKCNLKRTLTCGNNIINHLSSIYETYTIRIFRNVRIDICVPLYFYVYNFQHSAFNITDVITFAC